MSSLKEQIANQHDIVSIEQFKGYFLRLIEVNPIIKELLDKAEDNGKIVRWFDSDAPDKIKANYRQLATDLGIKFEQKTASEGEDIASSDTNITKEPKQKSTPDLTPEQELKALINSVNNAITKLNKPILLILDNLEHYKDAEEYLVNLPKKLVKVIITTRDSNMLDNPGQHIRLEPFSNRPLA
jgi:hypothetical protein